MTRGEAHHRADYWEFSAMVGRLKKPDHEILASLQHGDGDLIHMGMGLSKEAGEILDAICRYLIYRKPLDRDNIIEEIGDIEWFLEGLRQRMGLTRDQCIAANMAKLATRYPSGHYSDEQANARKDKDEPVDPRLSQTADGTLRID